MNRFMIATLLCLGILLSSAAADCDFQRHAKTALYGFNSAVHKNVDLEECMTLCDQEASFSCESFDYSRATSTCFLSQESRESQPGAFGKHAKSDYYERVCVDSEGGSGDEGSGDDDESAMHDNADGCPDEWAAFGSSCYLFKKQDLSWQDARDKCLSLRSNLVGIDTEMEFEFVTTQIREHTPGSHFEIWWTAGKKHGNTWVWDVALDYSSDVPMSYNKWYPGEPNNTEDKEDVVNLVLMDGQWGYNDGYSRDRIRYVCEKPRYSRVY